MKRNHIPIHPSLLIINYSNSRYEAKIDISKALYIYIYVYIFIERTNNVIYVERRKKSKRREEEAINWIM